MTTCRFTRSRILTGMSLVLLALATSAKSGSAEEGATPRKKIQEVDLRRLEIEGKVESPSSLFILESGPSLLPGATALDGLLGKSWLRPVEKDALDHFVIECIESGSGS